jgi:nitroreductase
METIEAIRTVRVVRRFSDQPIDDETLVELVHAARRAGSSKNLQRWSFLVVRERATLERLASVGPYARHVAGAAAAVALIVPRPEGTAWEPSESHFWDLGRAAQNLVLAAWDRGLGSVPATVYDEPLCRSILGYPADRYCGYVMSLGHPADPEDLARPPKAGGRVSLDDVLHWETW